MNEADAYAHKTVENWMLLRGYAASGSSAQALLWSLEAQAKGRGGPPEPPPGQGDFEILQREVERLKLENWQLKGALGYEVPGHIPPGRFKCGLCEARALEQTTS